MRCFFQAIFTDSEKSSLIIRNLSIFEICCNTLKTLINMFAEHVHHTAASGAHKMTMGSGAGIETICPAKAGKLLYLPQISEKREVPGYGTKADIGIDLLHVLIYKISGGMVCPAGKKFLDGFSLAAVFQCGHLSLLLSSNNSNCY